jgi:hypothetical protein
MYKINNKAVDAVVQFAIAFGIIVIVAHILVRTFSGIVNTIQ